MAELWGDDDYLYAAYLHGKREPPLFVIAFFVVVAFLVGWFWIMCP